MREEKQMSHFASNTAYGQEDGDNDDMIAHIRTANSHKYHLNLVNPNADTAACSGDRYVVGCEWGTTCNTKLPHLTIGEKNDIFELFEKNMKDIYISTWGWDRLEKVGGVLDLPTCSFTYFLTLQETYLLASTRPSYFLFITNELNKVIGFCLYRVEWDDEDEPEEPVLFSYELQVNQQYQGNGLGKFASLLQTQSLLHSITNFFTNSNN